MKYGREDLRAVSPRDPSLRDHMLTAQERFEARIERVAALQAWHNEHGTIYAETAPVEEPEA